MPRVARGSTADPTAEVIRRTEDGLYVRGRRYTLGEISRGTNISRPHITRVFNRNRGLSLKTAQKISGFLGIPIESLLSYIRPR